MLIFSALLIGFLGSFHCVGMCGPLVMALPGKDDRWQRFASGRLLYQLGRTTAYALLGAVVGSLGQGISFAGWQQGLSIMLGVGLLVIFLFPNWEKAVTRLPWIKRSLTRLRLRLGTMMKRNHLPTLFNIGVLNGFLPCGFVYVALAGALATGDILQGMAYMALFGLGTYPAMLGMSFAGRMLPKGWVKGAQPWLHGLAVVVTLLLVVRGLNLDIPYMSPDLQASEVSCE